MYRQFTPSAPMTKALSLPFSAAVGVLLTSAAWYGFGVVGVVVGWMLLLIPALAYLLGLPLAFASARLESTLRGSPTVSPATLGFGSNEDLLRFESGQTAHSAPRD
jgi:hypothetical protein